MTPLSTLITTLVLGYAMAIPIDDSSGTVVKRQSATNGNNGPFYGGFRGVSEFLGDPSAMDTIIRMVGLTGGNRTSAGNFTTGFEMVNQGYGPVPDAADVLPKRIALNPNPDIPAAQKVKIRYGPYKVPSMKTKNWLGLGGVLFNYPQREFAKPCENECTLLGISPGLEFADGTNANVDQGLWLHHLILYNTGPGREDPTCNHKDISVPHAVFGVTPRNGQRIFASGNERTNIVFPEAGVKDAGIKLVSTDKFGAVLEFMNDNDEDKIVYLTMVYDFIPGHPFKDDIRPLWFDIRQCGTSEATPPIGNAQFMFDYTWEASFDGKIISTTGHLHDGGTRTLLTVDDKPVCDSTATYGRIPEYIQKNNPAHEHGNGNGSTAHLSDMKVCFGRDLTNNEMKKGQKWRLEAHYNFNKYPAMLQEDNKSFETVMGIQLVYLLNAFSVID